MAAPDLVGSNLCAEKVAPLRKESRADSRDLFKGAMMFAEVSADFFASALGMLTAYSFSAWFAIGGMPDESLRETFALGLILGLIVIVLAHREGGYRNGSGLLRIQETERAIRIATQSLALLFTISELMDRRTPASQFAIAIVIIPTFLVIARQTVFAIAKRFSRGKNGAGRAVVYGAGSAGRSALSTLLHSPRLGLEPAAVIDENAGRTGRRMAVMGYRGRGAVPVQPGPVTPALLHSLECDLLLIAAQNLTDDDLATAIDAANQAGSDVALLTGPGTEQHMSETIDIDGLLFISSKRRSASWYYAVAKRIIDVVVSSAMLIVMTPILLLIAIMIRLDSPGPAIFVQKRVGRSGDLFDIFKFRSMYMDSPRYSFSPMSSSDPRLTRVGRLLRRISLDELPQLLNVLMGTMSLVGPRPEMPFIAERYNARDRQRLEVVPGITGLWQLSADRAYPIHQNMEYDLFYIRNRGFFMDVAILVHTLLFAMTGGI